MDDNFGRANKTAYRARSILLILVLTSFVSLIVACSMGSIGLSVSELIDAVIELVKGEALTLHATLFELRLHRALLAFVTGASLALAGALMQVLLRNPLADPYILGVSGGASVGALTAMLLGYAVWVIDVAAFGGAVAVSGLLFFLAYSDFKGNGNVEGSVPTLLLTGVIVGLGCMAVITSILSIAPDGQLRGMVFWLVGDLSGASARYFPWLVLIAALVVTCKLARSINIAALYADSASTLGVNVGRLRKVLFFFSALLTASAVSSVGSIGFVGLIMPHVCRLAWGPDHRLLLPAACLVGGSFLTLADAVARSIVAPQQLPVGVITALIGVPLFLVQLHHHRQYAK